MTARSDVPETTAASGAPGERPGLFTVALFGDLDMSRQVELQQIAMAFRTSTH